MNDKLTQADIAEGFYFTVDEGLQFANSQVMLTLASIVRSGALTKVGLEQVSERLAMVPDAILTFRLFERCGRTLH
jgi:hypothetical protein